MSQAYKVVTSNVNRITSDLKKVALKKFIYESEADIVLLQEVLFTNFTLSGFNTFLNVSPDESTGTAILTREGIPVQALDKLVSGRGLSCKIFNVTVLNLYAPSGNSNKAERATFFKNDLIYLLRQNPVTVLIGGDFNSVINRKDQTPNFNYSKELHDLIKNMKYQDAWEVKFPTLVKFTHFTSTSSSRIDRIYVSEDIRTNVLDADVIPTSFSDHCALAITINLARQPTKVYRSPWALNVAHLQDEELEDAVRQTWTTCLKCINRYRTKTEWWVKFAKVKLIQTVKTFSYLRHRDEKRTIEFYYSVLRDLYNNANDTAINLEQIKRVKAKIISITRQQLEGLQVKSKAKSLPQEEATSMYHLLKHNSNRQRTFIKELKTDDGRIVTEQQDIVREIQQHYARLYSADPIEAGVITDTIRSLPHIITTEDNTSLFSVFDEDEVFELIKTSLPNKSPGPDGLPKEFYQRFWPVIGTTFTGIVNEIIGGAEIPVEFKVGKIVLIPKSKGPNTMDKFRPLMLMNFDYKTVARAVKQRLTPLLQKIIKNHQACFPGRTILSTVSEYRDLISIVAVTNIRCALLFIDFSQAFDRVSHRYIELLMQRLGFDEQAVRVIHHMISGITAKSIINGQLTKVFHIDRGVPQGSPLSMLLYVLSLEPLLRRFNEKLTGITISGVNITVRAYADDVGVVVRNDSELALAKTEIETYSSLSGARINVKKSSILNLRGFENVSLPWAKLVDSHKTLGINFSNCPMKMAANNWRATTNSIQGAFQELHWRSTNLVQTVKIVNTYIFSKAFYVAQVFPAPRLQAKKIMKLAHSYVWKGNIFKVRLDSFTKSRSRGGLELTNVLKKASALYIKRTLFMINHDHSNITSKLFSIVRPESMQPPVNVGKLSYKLQYIKDFYLDVSYLEGNILRKVHVTTRQLLDHWCKSDIPNKIEKQYPNKMWKSVWENIHLKIHSSEVTSTWYKVVNDVVPTNEKLHRIGLSDTYNCCKCGLVDTLIHRFTCGGHLRNWEWVRQKIGLLTRTNERKYIPDILIRPDEKYFPEKKNNCIMWILGNYVNYIITRKGPEDIVSFKMEMETAYWRMKRFGNHKSLFGNMLDIVFEREGIG